MGREGGRRIGRPLGRPSPDRRKPGNRVSWWRVPADAKPTRIVCSQERSRQPAGPDTAASSHRGRGRSQVTGPGRRGRRCGGTACRRRRQGPRRPGSTAQWRSPRGTPVVVTGSPSSTGMRGKSLRSTRMLYWSAPIVTSTATTTASDHGPYPHRESLPGTVETGHPACDVATAVVGDEEDRQQGDTAGQANGVRVPVRHDRQPPRGRCPWRVRRPRRPRPAGRLAIRRCR